MLDKPKIEGITIAVVDIAEMLNFYQNVFGIKFEELNMHNSKLYIGKWDNLNLLFCPAEIAGNSAEQNRHQLDMVVSDLKKTIKTIKAFGGFLLDKIQEDENSLSLGIYDPDQNSIQFKQYKK